MLVRPTCKMSQLPVERMITITITITLLETIEKFLYFDEYFIGIPNFHRYFEFFWFTVPRPWVIRISLAEIMKKKDVCKVYTGDTAMSGHIQSREHL